MYLPEKQKFALHETAEDQTVNHGGAGKEEVHIVVSRNAAGSSARFVSAFIAAFMAYSQGPPLAPFPNESLAAIGEGSTLPALPGPPRPHRPLSGDTAEKRFMRPVLERCDSPKRVGVFKPTAVPCTLGQNPLFIKHDEGSSLLSACPLLFSLSISPFLLSLSSFLSFCLFLYV